MSHIDLEDKTQPVNSYTYYENLTSLLPDLPADSIVSRTFSVDERFKAVLFGFAAGQELSEHTASQPALLLFLQGEAELTIGEDVMTTRPGAWVHMPADTQHRIVAKTPLIMLLLLLRPEKEVDQPS